MMGDLSYFDQYNQDEDEFILLLHVFFFISTIVLTIILLNLLIAIISDIFSKVRVAEQLTKVWERWNIITEIDVVSRKKNPPKQKYLLCLYNKDHLKTNEEDEKKKRLEDEKKKRWEIDVTKSLEDILKFNQELKEQFGQKK